MAKYKIPEHAKYSRWKDDDYVTVKVDGKRIRVRKGSDD